MSIPGPGKFEGEPSYAPALYALSLDEAPSFYDGETPVFVFDIDGALLADLRITKDVDPEDLDALTPGDSILLWEDGQGFCCTRVVGFEDLERTRFALCRECGAQYSADQADYFMARADTVLSCCDEPCVLATEDCRVRAA